MNILVTGGAGFIGSHYCRYVLENYPQDKVFVLDALTYAGNLSTINDIRDHPRFRFYKGRIEDENIVAKILREDEIDAIVNFAAQTHNDRSLLSSKEFLETNVIGVHNLLVCARRANVKRIVHVSTDEVYGSISEGEFMEESPLKPNTPYSASKAGGDLLCRAHFVSYSTPVIITRGGNTYGPYQYPEKLISFFVTRLLDNKVVPLYGDGSQVREWIHVEDHVSGVDIALRYGKEGEIYNIADKNERKNIYITELILEILKKPKDLIRYIPDPRGKAHDLRYSMNCEKIKKLGWKPKVPFEKGLRSTVEWYSRHQDWWRPLLQKPEFKTFVADFYGTVLGKDL